MFTLHDLTVFIAVADGGSVRQAASDMNRTQSAISQAIRRLEDSVGFPLLDRSEYRSRLTERGELFLKRARDILQQSKDLNSYAEVLERGNEPCLRLAVHGALHGEQWMHLIRHIPEQFPDTVLEIHTAEGHAPKRLLNSEKVDFAIIIMGSGSSVLDVEHRWLGEIELVQVAHSKYSGANVESNLARLPRVFVADFEDPSAEFGVTDSPRFWRVSDFNNKVAAIANGYGWGTVPVWMVEKQLSEGLLSPVEFRGAPSRSSHSFFLCHRPKFLLGPVAQSIWETP